MSNLIRPFIYIFHLKGWAMNRQNVFKRLLSFKDANNTFYGDKQLVLQRNNFIDKSLVKKIQSSCWRNRL